MTIFRRPVAVVDQDPELSRLVQRRCSVDAGRLVAAPRRPRAHQPGSGARGRPCSPTRAPSPCTPRRRWRGSTTRWPQRGHAALPADRFRANIVIDGFAAHAEDDVDLLEAGDVRLAFAQVDERCVVTTVDQRAGDGAARSRCARWRLPPHRRGGVGVRGLHRGARPGHAARRRRRSPDPEVVAPPDNGGPPRRPHVTLDPRPRRTP